jgi:hypothetical protein
VKNTDGIATVRRCLAGCFCIGQFACLLPTLVVVAVSQAPSPESNPDSPLPVKATVVQYTTVKLIGQKLLRSSRGAAPRGRQSTTESANTAATMGQPESTTATHWPCGRWSLYQLGVHPPPRWISAGNPVKGPTPSPKCRMADWVERVLATRFSWMSNRVHDASRHQAHFIAEMTADVRSHSQIHCHAICAETCMA